MDPTLRRLIDRRLYEAPPKGRGAELLMAACDGAAALQGLLSTGTYAPPAVGATQDSYEADPPGAFLQSITVEGFRGVGATATLDLQPVPGLTLVVGRNGSGKSSFAEGLEMLLTGKNLRWEDRSKVWRDGWRNLHHPTTRVATYVVVEGTSGVHVVERRWPDAGDLEASVLTVDGKPDEDLATLGWSKAMAAYRPFLTHNEVGTRLDGKPTTLHDALATVLGLEDLTVVGELLANERLERDKAWKAAAEKLDGMLPRLEEVDDDRARAAFAALNGSTWDLAALGRLLHGDTDAMQWSALALLTDLSRLSLPTEEAVAAAAAAVDESITSLATFHGTDAAKARLTANLLEQALRFHDQHGDADCPVCGGSAALNASWHVVAEAQVKRLRDEAADVDAAHQRLRTAMVAARGLLQPLPAVVARAGEVGLDVSIVDAAWTAWFEAPTEPERLPEHLLSAYLGLRHAVDVMRSGATAELERRQDLWRPLARELATWEESARRAVPGKGWIRDLQAAERWLREASDALRDERFRPIAEKAQTNWSLLKQQSNVDIGTIRLEGSKTLRHVALDATVDGAPGPALAMMSQGELNCLSLSLFLPRALLPDSPFRFVVIDDPVQAMDPAKVDGLARCLEISAHHRQVIVFTHDERLPEAVRNLGIAATILEVTRRDQSRVELRLLGDTVTRHIEDAFAVAHTQDDNPHAGRVVPGFCRAALEAACARVVRRRRLRAGATHDDIDRELAGVTTLNMWMALLIRNDARLATGIAEVLRSRFGDDAHDAFVRARRGPHERDAGNLVHLVRQTERFASEILRQS